VFDHLDLMIDYLIEPDCGRSKKMAGFIFIPAHIELSPGGTYRSSPSVIEIERRICPETAGGPGALSIIYWRIVQMRQGWNRAVGSTRVRARVRGT